MTLHLSGRGHRLLVLAAALLVTAATPQVTAVAATSRTSGTAGATHGADNVAASVVTLITGDKVTVTPATPGGPGSVTVQAPDGGPAAARVLTVGGDTYVYPESALPYTASGALDDQLFDVTRLIADGYDDASLPRLPLIVTYGGKDASASALRKRAVAVPGGDLTGVRPLTSVNGVALAADRAETRDLWGKLTGRHTDGVRASGTGAAVGGAPFRAGAFTGGVAKVWLDGRARATLSDSVAQIGAPGVWAGGNTGEGVDVAVLDTGYDEGHPDLRDVVRDSDSFVPGESVTDRNGHGTHVASTIAGSGAASGGKERGVAPGVRLHVGKVLADEGYGYDSWILAGMEWAARDVHARVISMSLGSAENADGETVLAQAVDELSSETGALFTIAAGNDGPGAQTVRSPGTADAALTVGAVDSSDAIADFSSRGPRYGDDAIKPEITAPGVGILAARSQYIGDGSGFYMSASGTSMATPHVAGVAALVAAAHPDWTGSRIKDALVSTAEATPDIGADDGGNGRVDAAAAATASLTATGTIDAGIHSPGTDDGAVTSPATWTNTGDGPVTATLAVDAPGVPDGVFSLGADHVVVPAHGTVTTTVTTDLDKAGAGQRWTGRLTASADGKVLTRTLLGVSTRQRLFHVRTRITGRAGEDTDGVLTFYRRGDEYAGTYLYGGGGSDQMLPPGRYSVYADFRVEGTHGAASAGYARLVLPQVDVTGPTDLVLDGTTLREVKEVTPRTTENFSRRLDYHREFGDGSSVTDSTLVPDGYDSVWTSPTTAVRDGEQYFTARWRDQEPLLTATSGGQKFDDLWIMPGSTKLPEDTYDLKVIHPGDGLAEDYEGVDAVGKAAVLRWNSDDEDVSDEQIRAAQAAGVKLLLFVNDLDGRLRQPVIRTSVEVAGLSRTTGEKLISRADAAGAAGVALRAVSRPDTDYLYDLVRTWKGRIPANPVYAPGDSRLARVETSFHNPTGREVYENRYDIHPWTTYRVGSNRLSTAGAHRTDYVTADGGFTWTEEGELQSLASSVSGSVRYQAGRTTDVEWFGPVVRPRINGSVTAPLRTADRIDVAVPSWGDSGGDHANYSAFASEETTQETSLYRGRTLVATGGDGVSATVPAKRDTYRLVHKATRTATAAFPYSTATRTEWTFSSAAPGGADGSRQLPLVQVDYTVPTADDGKAASGARLTVTPVHLDGGPDAALRTSKVELSYDDGVTWSTARLSGLGDGAVSFSLHAPASARFVSLRVRAGDSLGNSVTQTVVRAAGIAR
ncbi:S8 family serine peptidase [Streptomyces sp. ME109]|uniref:S8 family serine peptidase n=1 Tax=Streptomyces sp. me109 TaxID=1827853 RepID=UPI001651793A|nr:S8 family serine peptidase [Streptomyces sp. me109]